MPGIFGVIAGRPLGGDRQQQGLIDLVRTMSAAMMYEPSYSEVVMSLPEVGACVGRVGLRVEGKRPDINQSSDIVAVTTGERLSQTHDAQRSQDDSCLGPYTGDVVRTYGQSGEDVARRMSFACSAFLADQRASKCLLFNDRYGRERIFLHSDGERTVFSSEAKAILAVAPRTRAFDPTGLAQMMACGCTLDTKSLFKGIDVLEAGTLLVFDRSGRVARRRYFRPEDLESLEAVEGTAFLEGFSASLRAAVNQSAKSFPQVGISLTGGLDSRMIMASLDVPRDTIPCYTFGSMYRATGDVTVARRVAAVCGQPHTVIEVGKPFLSKVQQHLEQAVYVSDGYIGLSGAAELYVNRIARGIAPARMTGNWGGELLRGVRAFKYVMPKGGFIWPDLNNRIVDSATAFSTMPAHPVSAALFQQMPFQSYGRNAIERSQVASRDAVAIS
jgi:asparagine synthase (glutamine-hydrolysing)